MKASKEEIRNNTIGKKKYVPGALYTVLNDIFDKAYSAGYSEGYDEAIRDQHEI